MIAILKASCLLVYALGAAAFAGLLPESLSVLGLVAAALLAAHVFEAVVMFKYIKRHPGPLAESLWLTLLYGLLHWAPLRKQALAEK